MFQPHRSVAGLCLLLMACLSLMTGPVSAAGKPLTIVKAVYNTKKSALSVTTRVKKLTGSVSLLHGDGGLLGVQAIDGKKQSFAIGLAQLGQVPCTVEARVGAQRAIKPVVGAPSECKKILVCQILAPTAAQQLTVNTPFEFKGQVKLKDKKAKVLTYEWDFAGGVMGVDGSAVVPNTMVRPNGLTGTTQFVRDNSVYRIHFSATDKLKRRCEAVVEVKVGTPPSDLADFPTKVVEPAIPFRGSENNGEANDLVVLPFEDWSMQNQTDARMKTSGNSAMFYTSAGFAPKHSNLRAHVIKKGSVGTAKPVYLDDSGDDAVTLQYAAASNPLDPVGADSINSTSQNWPLNSDITVAAPLMSAKLQKTDWWEAYQNRPDGEKLDPASYTATSLFAGQPPDQKLGFAGTGVMPGKTQPYSVNLPQDFARYEASNQWFEANEIPITDVDDRGRVNPLPLMRVQVLDKATGQVRAATDAVLSNSKDFHCRECHSKEQVGGKSTGHSANACQYTPWGLYGGTVIRPSAYCQTDPDTQQPRTDPDMLAVSDPLCQSKTDCQIGDANSLFNEEFVAARNWMSLHGFYDSVFTLEHDVPFFSSPQTVSTDVTSTCGVACHLSKAIDGGATTAPGPGANPSRWNEYSASNDQTGERNEYSWTMHYFHAQLQYNADKSDIVRHQGESDQSRYPDGSIKRWDFGKGPNNSTVSGSLFPIFDANGRQLPMEQNCLRCHAGHREQLYRDRMLTAERTCYDCHGDMGAVGQAFKKPDALSQGATGRTSWADEPDCAACHTGSGNQGQDGANGYFSAGVMQRAFDDEVTIPGKGEKEHNYAATPRRPDLADPDRSRFAVVLTERNQDIRTLGGVVYRLGKDQHGYTGCPACHGAAHGIGPNRDPKSNDNVASIELQGYPGHIYECNVCHTKDAFNSEESIGSILHYPDRDGKPTILAGPHNLHPVNDPNWYRERTTGAVRNTDGSQYGGWHNIWSGKPGLNREDQCAACHGADHLGTRLSKTPVDRVFDFSKLDFKKLKAVGFKAKIVKVKAGAAIGCNTCHSIATGTRKTPTETQTHRSSPVILPPDTPEFAIDSGDTTFSYQVPTQNPDHDALSYSVGSLTPDFQTWPPIQYAGLSIDQQGLITWSKPDVPGLLPFRVKITGSGGGMAERWYWTNLASCATGKQPGAVLTCTDIQLADGGFAMLGVNLGESLSYQVPASTSDQRLLTFAMLQFRQSADTEPQSQPPGIALDGTTGLLNWPSAVEAFDNADSGLGPYYLFPVLVKDTGDEQNLDWIAIFVCKPPQHWDADMMMCMDAAP